MNADDSAEVAMVGIRCTYCDAAPGEWCVTTSGARSGYLHSARFYDWRETADTEPPKAHHRAEWPPVIP
jgi:hypothetical protein